MGPDIVKTRRGIDIKLNEALYITPDDSIQNWYIPVGYARTTSPQVGTGITADTLVEGTTYTRTTDAQVYNYCWDNYEAFDLDGDGVVSALDAHIFTKWYAFGASMLISVLSDYNSLFSSNATRTDTASIIEYILKYSDETQTASFSSGDTVIGITTNFGSNDPDLPRVRPGIAVAGTGIPANTTVTGIGAGTMTISLPTTSTETDVTLTFGNGLHNIRGGPYIQATADGLILSRIFGNAEQPGSPYTAVHYESHQYSNDVFLDPNDGGPAQFKRYQKVSIADTTSNAGGARYISTEAPSAGIGTDGDIWYDISATGDSAGTNGNIPIGGIIMWYGSVANIPTSWRLCDGQSHSTAIGTIQTPDLRGQFVVGAADDSVEGTFSNNVGVGSTGGSADAVIVEHEHTAGTLAGSFNYYPTGEDYANFPRIVANNTTNTPGAISVTISGSTGSVGVGSTNANLPPYYALAYIMRIL